MRDGVYVCMYCVCVFVCMCVCCVCVCYVCVVCWEGKVVRL